MTVGFVGAGSWGTTLAIHLAELGNDVLLWGNGAPQRETMRHDRENRRYLPDVPFPIRLEIVESPADAARAEVVVIATPTQFIRQTLAEVPPELLRRAVVVSVSKGIEQRSLLRISQLLAATHGIEPERFVALSGPSHAEEVARRIPTLLVAASADHATAETVRELFLSDTLRVYSSDDLAGVELGGALKNVIALCAGILDGLAMGDNTKAALITRGLAEIARLGESCGADTRTFAGLSGLGDLVVTCTSRHSRNRWVGEQIGKGRPLAEVVADMTMVAEGVGTTASAFELAQKLGVETPIINAVHDVLFRGKDPRDATFELMTREPRPEIWG